MNVVRDIPICIVILIFLSVFKSETIAQSSIQKSERQIINFDKDWLYYRGDITNDAAKEILYRDEDWQFVQLPHAPKITPLRHPWKIPDSEGINWYRKQLNLPVEYQSKKIFIEFEAADKIADVWLNGTHMIEHEGPYLPFTVDITPYVNFGDVPNTLAVKVSNLEDRDIPQYGTWISFGGLYRDVHLIVTDQLHVTDAVYAGKVADGGVFVTYPVISDSLAQLMIRTNILNEYTVNKTCKIITNLINADDQIVATIESESTINAGKDYTFSQIINLEKFELWHPYHPNLYQVYSLIYDGSKLVDHISTRVGIRRIQYSATNGFSINGERFRFRGANRVQEYPYIAWAFPNQAQRRDALILKEAGFDYLRLSHNPQDPSFLDACDELGILVMDCIPGFQYVGGKQFLKNSYQTMRQMIRRDRNHPSIILWELSLNESDFDARFAQEAMKIGHEEFPGDQCFVAGWKFPDVYDIFLRATQHGARNFKGNSPLVISEYGHWDYGGGNSSSDVDRRDGEGPMLQQAKNHQESLNLNLGMPNLCGDGLWVSIDFQCYPSGILDYFRLPKFSYYFFRSQRDPDLKMNNVDTGPMVFIANYWMKQSVRSVKVYSNCERVDLYLNDDLIKSQKPDSDTLSTYLPHPPFTFVDVPFQSGELRAIGYIDSKEAAVHSRKTPGKPKSLSLRFGSSSDAADREDIFFVYASVLDENGTIVPVNDREIHFSVSGVGIVVSPATVTSEAGIATVLIRTKDIPGDLIVTAEADNLDQTVIKKEVQ